MKKLFIILTILLSWNQVSTVAVTLDADLLAALPSGEFFLPGPPEVGTPAWSLDSLLYFHYKELGRVYNAATQDCWDSVWAKMNEQYYFALHRYGADSVMNAPFLTNVSWTKNAAGKYTVTYTRNTTDFPEMNALEQLCEQMKEENTSSLWRTRMRPYCYFGDWYAGKKYVVGTANANSYPSGHGYFAGLFGMCMLYIDPANALAIKRMTDEWAACRLILGAHWATDIADGKQLGTIAFAIAMNYDQFRNQVEAAKAELETYRAAHPPVLTQMPSASGQPTIFEKMLWDGQIVLHSVDKSYTLSGAEK